MNDEPTPEEILEKEMARLDELESNWKELQTKYATRFRDLQYHEEYYQKIKERLLEEQLS